MTARRNRSRPGRVVLEDRMVLLGWLHSQLGYGSTDEMLSDAKEAGEGFDSEGHSHVCSRLISRDISGEFRKFLKKYDRNICKHLIFVNDGRTEPITLKYFQYLAVLYTEIFLDCYFNRRGALLLSLNDWVDRFNNQTLLGRLPHGKFGEGDLKKLAFWMATGSGKTHVMHINYLQFLHYNTEPLDNILLVTPNEGLSAQHLKELAASNIPAERLSVVNGAPETGRVSVIEITKLSTDRSGGKETIPVEALEGNNLVFVDEGHKGSSGDAWRDRRDAISRTGFTFEYSATFRQALAAAKDDELVEEYGRAIAFDYSYRHFHGDGYGKDFDIVNLRRETDISQTDTLLLGNLLSFYEQRLVFDECRRELLPYNLERPLLMFVGSSVNTREGEKVRSDVLTVVRFLHRFLADERWAVRHLGRLLRGRSGLKDGHGRDVFGDRFCYLRGRSTGAAAAYRDMLDKIFHADHGGGLCLCNMRGANGEMGLKAAGSKGYFGLIYVGDKANFGKLVESNDPAITLEPDAFSGSLFAGINHASSTVEMLIGVKKFMEGWNSWRVSSMGLLNIGKREGAQIIQLFGRGVRLRGRDMSLKRSPALAGPHPNHIRPLETLNIFALRADYMELFHALLEEAGIHGTVEMQLPVRTNTDLLGSDLVVPCLQEGASFAEDASIVLDVDKDVRVRVDLLPKVDRVVSSTGIVAEMPMASPGGRRIPEGSLALVDMPEIYANLLASKERRGWHNMVVRPDAPTKILAGAEYEIVAEDPVLEPRSWAGVQRLQDAAAAVVSKYAERFYRMRRERWEHDRIHYRTLDKNDPNFRNYDIIVPDNERDNVRKVQELVDECDRVYKEETDTLPNVHFDRHLYLPLLLAHNNKIKISPPGLNNGEEKFVRDLLAYCRDVKPSGVEIFLLRNQSRGRGIGFFETGGFYPDFVLWVKSCGKQRVVFVDPHGMYYEDQPDDNEKANLYRKMRELTDHIKQKPDSDVVTLDSYMVSQTSLKVLINLWGKDWNRQRLAEHHILFPERGEGYDYVAEIVQGTE